MRQKARIFNKSGSSANVCERQKQPESQTQSSHCYNRWKRREKENYILCPLYENNAKKQ